MAIPGKRSLHDGKPAELRQFKRDLPIFTALRVSSAQGGIIPTDLPKELRAHQSVTAVADKVEPTKLLQHDSLETIARTAEKHPVIHIDIIKPRINKTDRWVVQQKWELRLQLLRLPQIVGVDQGDELSLGGSNA
jgi:hypothetical protein